MKIKSGMRDGVRIFTIVSEPRLRTLLLTDEEYEALVTAVELTFDTQGSGEVNGLFDPAVVASLWAKVHTHEVK